MERTWFSRDDLMKRWDIGKKDLMARFKRGFLRAEYETPSIGYGYAPSKSCIVGYNNGFWDVPLSIEEQEAMKDGRFKWSDLTPEQEHLLQEMQKPERGRFDSAVEWFTTMTERFPGLFPEITCQEDVESILQRPGIEPFHIKDIKELEQAPKLFEEPIEAGKNRFSKHVDFWKVEFKEETGSIKDSKGMRYIAYLLGRPRQNVDALDLVRAIDPAEVADGNQPEDIPVTKPSKMWGTNPDKIGKEIKLLMAEKEEAIDDVEKEEISRKIKQKIKAYEKCSKRIEAQDQGLENERKRVSKAINTAIKNMKNTLPELSKHLRDSIHTGYTFSYHADEQWETEN